jgi:hypothetical protein
VARQGLHTSCAGGSTLGLGSTARLCPRIGCRAPPCASRPRSGGEARYHLLFALARGSAPSLSPFAARGSGWLHSPIALPGARSAGAHDGGRDARSWVGGGHARDCCHTFGGTGGAGAGPFPRGDPLNALSAAPPCPPPTGCRVPSAESRTVLREDTSPPHPLAISLSIC